MKVVLRSLPGVDKRQKSQVATNLGQRKHMLYGINHHLLPIIRLYPPIAVTVPTTNILIYMKAPILVGRASAGRTTKRASGCNP